MCKKNRFIDLLEKLCSIKGLFFIACFVLVWIGNLESQYFFFAGVIVVGDRTLEKWILKK